MYTINDTKAAILEVQRFLLAVSQIEKSIPNISVDGFYDEETKAAVIQFQRLHSLPETGKVDKSTFDILFFEYQKIIDRTEHINAVYGNDEFPLSLGSSGENVLILHALLSQLGNYYEFSKKPRGDYYGIETENVIKEMQRIFVMEESGYTDEELIVRMRAELEAREKFKKQS